MIPHTGRVESTLVSPVTTMRLQFPWRVSRARRFELKSRIILSIAG